jgi:hypothetical protein
MFPGGCFLRKLVHSIAKRQPFMLVFEIFNLVDPIPSYGQNKKY